MGLMDGVDESLAERLNDFYEEEQSLWAATETKSSSREGASRTRFNPAASLGNVERHHLSLSKVIILWRKSENNELIWDYKTDF